MRSYFRPIPVLDPAEIAGTYPLAGGWARFAQVECLERGRAPQVMPASDLDDDTLARLSAPRPAVSGLDLTRPNLMGVVNVTPDSFSDGGDHLDPGAALRRARTMVAEGADLIDIGGESTRPGAEETPEAEEIARITPVLQSLQGADLSVPLSLDTRKAAVARAGLSAGADMINDVSGLRHDPALAAVAAEAEAPLILMHSLGTPETMQALAVDAYDDVLLDVLETLDETVARTVAAGVPRARIMVDPGIGFGKTDPQQLALLRRISAFHDLGVPILLGVSRKGMIGRIGGAKTATDRGPGSAGIGLWALSQGIQMLRVHDVFLHNQMIALWAAAGGLPGAEGMAPGREQRGRG